MKNQNRTKLCGAFRRYFEVIATNDGAVLKLHFPQDKSESFANSKYFIEYFLSKIIFLIHFEGTFKYACFINHNIEYVDEQAAMRDIKIIEAAELGNQKVYPIIIFSYERIETLPQIKPETNIIKNTLYKTLKYFGDIYAVFKRSQALNVLQLINSPNDHIAHGHQTEDVIVEIAYYDERYSHISTFTIAAHYCHKCNKYYDYYHSFEAQIRNAGISGSNILTRIINSSGARIAFSSGYFREKSLLKIMGYAVGISGYTEEWRRNILDTAVFQGLMTPGEIKKHINMMLNLFKNKNNMKVAIDDWQSDIEYVNDQIKNHRYKTNN